jgi:two-component system response regulator NreC
MCRVLEEQGGFEVVAEASDVDETFRELALHHPDVLVLDLNMPGRPTLEAIPEMRRDYPSTQIVVLTMQDEPAYARRALGDGVLGYVLKDAADEELVEAVRQAAAGHRYLNPRMGARMAAQPPAPPRVGLSEREVEVLRLVALGYTNNEIADRLVLSVRTVETHRAHIQQKLGLRARSELVRYALDHGLIEP